MVIIIKRETKGLTSSFYEVLMNVLQFQPSVKKARLHESPHTCCIHQFLMYTSVYKDSTAFWPAASGTQCKAKIRVTYT